VLLDAIAQLRCAGRKLTATLVGDGPDRAEFIAHAAANGLSDAVRFAGVMPARKAFALGRVMIAPSRQESLPYVVLETAAAQKPLITTSVGGIPEIYGPMSSELVPPGNAEALARAIADKLDHPDRALELAQHLRARVAASFSVDVMVDGVLSAYGEALRARHAKAGAPLTAS
jgi:glycosyltransferase involved in cell wall biosynthesis